METKKYECDPNEVCFEAEWFGNKINGWDITSISQNLCRQAKEIIKSNFKIKKFCIRLSIFGETKGE